MANKINKHWITACIFFWCSIIAALFSWDVITLIAAIILSLIGLYELTQGYNEEENVRKTEIKNKDGTSSSEKLE